MVWGRHWKQRIGVTLARGRGQVVMAELRVKGGGEGPRGERGWATQEWDPNVGGGPPAAVQPEEKRDERGEKGEKAREPREGEEKNKHGREKKRGNRGADGEGSEGKKQRRATGANLVKGEMTKGREEDEERERDSGRESKEAREGRRKEGDGVEGDEGAAKEEMKDVV